VGVLVVDENVETIPEELAAIVESLLPKVNGPTVEVISHGACGEQPGAEVLKALPVTFTGCPMLVQLVPMMV
jgi:hypothetical protein